MLRRVLVVVAVTLGLAFTLGAPLAYAHRTGTEIRTFRGCNQLPRGERAACKVCLSRKRPHHFHPENPAGERCRPNNGRP